MVTYEYSYYALNSHYQLCTDCGEATIIVISYVLFHLVLVDDGYEDLDSNNDDNEDNDPSIYEANFGSDDDYADAPGNDDSDIEVHYDRENDPPVNLGPNNDHIIYHNEVPPRRPNSSGESSLLSRGNGDVNHNSNSNSSNGSSRFGDGNEVENSGYM